MNHPSPIRRKLRALSIPSALSGEMGGNAQSPGKNSSRKGEDGYMLLIAVFFIALMVIALAVAMPQVIKSIQRDHDLEAYNRGKQYRRAIQLYYRKFHAYPPNVDALVNTNQIKFLRKKYTDPITGKADWKPVLFGQNKTPTAMGFFGQPLAGNASTIAGVGPSGGGMAGLPGITSMGGNSTSGFGGTSASGFGLSGSSGTSGSTSSSGSSGMAGGSGSNSTSGTSSSSDQSGQTFGGAGIIGFSPDSSKQSILVYKKKNHYNEWEFTYDPISDMQQMNGGNPAGIGQPASGTTNPVGSNPLNNTNSPNPSSGPGLGSGSSPTSP